MSKTLSNKLSSMPRHQAYIFLYYPRQKENNSARQLINSPLACDYRPFSFYSTPPVLPCLNVLFIQEHANIILSMHC